MRYAIKVNQSGGGLEIPRVALEFIRALECEGHRVVRVFFYHDGVHQGFGPLAHEWVELSERNHFDLVLCSQAMEARSLPFSPSSGFMIGGLALWVDACLKADRVMTFGVPVHGA